MRTVALILFALVTDFVCAEQNTRIDAQVCGANSLALAASYVSDIRADQVHALLPPTRAPFSLHDLDRAARPLGLRTAVLRWKHKRQARFDCPAILHVRARLTSNSCDHFITCFGEQGELLCVADYPHPPAMVPREQVLAFWEGDALYLDDSQGARIAGLRTNSPMRIGVWMLAGLTAVSLALVMRRGIQRRRTRQRLPVG